MDIGSAMRWNKLEESHFGSHFNKRGTDSWMVSTDCVWKRVLRKHITGTSDGAAQSGETFIVCKEWSWDWARDTVASFPYLGGSSGSLWDCLLLRVTPGEGGYAEKGMERAWTKSSLLCEATQHKEQRFWSHTDVGSRLSYELCDVGWVAGPLCASVSPCP